MEFKLYRLMDLIDNFDYLRKPLSSLEREKFKGKYPYYGAQGIIDYVRDFRCDGEFLLIAEDGENLNSRKQPIAQIANGKFWVNNHAHIVKTNENADIYFLCYALNYLDITGYITGSAQPKLSQGNLNKIKVLFPNILNQCRISTYLKKYDELIENNNQRIKLLEQMAESIYKEWFVRFRFPGYERIKTKIQSAKGWTFGERENGQTIPNSWNFRELKAIAEFKRGKNITSSQMIVGDIPVISAGLEPSGYHNEANVKGYNLTVSASGANAGYLSYHLRDIWAADCSYYQEENKIWFVYNSLKFLQPVINNMQVGSAQPHVYAKNINRITTIIPTKDMIELFVKTVSPLYDLIKYLQKKNENLIKQRDALLPRLMSGKIEIEDKEVK